MMQTQIRNFILNGWRPQDIAHATGHWPPCCQAFPPEVPSAILDAWLLHPSGAHTPEVMGKLVDAPLLHSSSPTPPPALRKIRALIAHAQRCPTSAEARAFYHRAQLLCTRYRLPDTACTLPGHAPHPRTLVAQRVLIAEPLKRAKGVVLRRLAHGIGVIVVQMHSSGIWTLIGQHNAVEHTSNAYEQVVRCPWPGLHRLDETQACNLLLGAAQHYFKQNMPETPAFPPSTGSQHHGNARQLALVEKLVLSDNVDPPPPEFPTWQAVGASWYATHGRLPPKLVELQA